MSKIAEIISIDGEVISLSDCTSEKEFEYKILNSLDFQNIKSYFIKKTIIELVKERHKKTNGSNGVTTVEMMNILKREDIEPFLNELQEKKIIELKKGINSDMYFVYKK